MKKTQLHLKMIAYAVVSFSKPNLRQHCLFKLLPDIDTGCNLENQIRLLTNLENLLTGDFIAAEETTF